MAETMTESTGTGCGCGCGSVSTITSAESCSCGCSCCGEAVKSPEQEIGELHTLRDAIERRLAELGA